MSTSAAGLCEFEEFHRYYWTHESLSYVRGPVVLHRNVQDGGVLSLHGCTLRRTHPSLGDTKYEVLSVSATSEEWYALVEETFFMPLDDLTEDERHRLWQLASSDPDSEQAQGTK
jgi:hypothetical protein